MSLDLDNEFIQVLSAKLENHCYDLRMLRECLTEFKNNGMGKDSIKNLCKKKLM